MGYNVIIKPEAEEDIIEATEWFDEQSKLLSQDFLLKLSETIKLLKNNPYHFQKRYKNIHLVISVH
jgi:toxin ParE1/3/4